MVIRSPNDSGLNALFVAAEGRFNLGSTHSVPAAESGQKHLPSVANIQRNSKIASWHQPTCASPDIDHVIHTPSDPDIAILIHSGAVTFQPARDVKERQNVTYCAKKD